MANFQIDRLKWIPYVIGILLTIALFLSVYNFIETKNGEWACIAQQCLEYASGEEWVNQNCVISNGEPICKFTYNNQDYELPLNQIESDKMVSCKKSECAVEVYVRRYDK